MLLFLFLLVGISIFITFLIIFLVSRAIIFAKGTFALIAAVIVSQSDCILVPNHGFLNFIAWALICFGIIYFISILPRIDISIRFLCTLAISLIVIDISATLLGNIFIQSFEVITIYEISIKAVCIGISIFGIYLQGKKFPSDSSSKTFVRFVDRLVASILYGISIMVVCLSMHGNWNLSSLVQFLVLVGSTICAFVADIFFAEKILFGYNSTNEIKIPH